MLKKNNSNNINEKIPLPEATITNNKTTEISNLNNKTTTEINQEYNNPQIIKTI